LTEFLSLTNVLTGSATKIVHASANATAAFTDVALQVSRGALSLAAEAWHGIDLLDVVANASALRWAQSRHLPLSELNGTTVGEEILKLPLMWRILVLRGLASASADLPYFVDSHREFVASGKYWEFELEVKVSGDFIMAKFFYGEVAFRPRWSNPLWEIMEHPVSKEIHQLAEAVHSALDHATGVPWRYQPLPLPADLDLPTPTTSSRWAFFWWARPPSHENEVKWALDVEPEAVFDDDTEMSTEVETGTK